MCHVVPVNPDIIIKFKVYSITIDNGKPGSVPQQNLTWNCKQNLIPSHVNVKKCKYKKIKVLLLKRLLSQTNSTYCIV